MPWKAAECAIFAPRLPSLSAHLRCSHTQANLSSEDKSAPGPAESSEKTLEVVNGKFMTSPPGIMVATY